ncbi:hypothetical protein AX17_000195 [Amanita inopinata Kibby_2008]|nr:hypothetical protein AX17_000195 [Amanita inopinata Kibby_2008]
MENLVDILPPSLQPASQPTQAYLNHLTSLPLLSLLDEPGTLQTQSHHLTSSLSSLIHTAYPTFLSLHDTTRALGSSLSSLSGSLDSLVTISLPNLDACTSTWREKTDSLLEERRRARVVLEQHDKVRDLLDTPVLLETCVRNGYFAEALSLKSHVEALVNAHMGRASTTNGKGKGKETEDANYQAEDKRTVTRLQPPEILSSVLSEVHYAIDQMHLSLLQTLHDPTKKLPALWKAVNFLRKMDAFHEFRYNAEGECDVVNGRQSCNPDSERGYVLSSEEQLALAFLTGREACLRSVLDTLKRDVERVLPLIEQYGTSSGSQRMRESDENDHASIGDREREDLARYLKKYIEAWREGVYDIVTQFSTIFLERLFQSHGQDTHTPTMTNGTNNTPNTKTSLPPATHNLIARLRALVTTHATHALNVHLLPVLSLGFPLLSASLLSSLLTQLTYCATAFSRVGLDFRSLLDGVTTNAVEHIVRRELTQVGYRWARRVRKAGLASSDRDRRKDRSSLMVAKKTRVQEIPTAWLVASSATSNPPLPSPEVNGSRFPPNVPPQILASYPPLAALTNALMSILNGLRLLAPIEILGSLRKVMESDVLATGGEAILEYIKQVTSNPGDDDESEAKERRAARAAGQVYFEVLLPFATRALMEGVYGVSEVQGLWSCQRLEAVSKEWEAWVSQ